MGPLSKVFGTVSDEEIALMVDTMKKWPVKRTSADLTQEVYFRLNILNIGPNLKDFQWKTLNWLN